MSCGPADELTALGIGVVADLPVGRRLLDHPYFHTASTVLNLTVMMLTERIYQRVYQA
jgi:hypothetical protein